MSPTPGIAGKAAELGEAFDRSFALPPAAAAQDSEELVAIGVAGDPYAVRLAEIAGIIAGRRVTPIAAAASHLLGIAGVRGEIVPVFGLASILGHAEAAASARWIILCGGEEPVALAFPRFEGCLRLAKSAIHPDRSPRSERQPITHVANTDTGTRAVISIPRVLASIQRRAGSDSRHKE